MGRESETMIPGARAGEARALGCDTGMRPDGRGGTAVAGRSGLLAAAGRAAARGERDLAAIDATCVLAAESGEASTRAAALHLLGVVHMQRDRFDLAACFLDQAVQADPTNGSYAAHLRLVRREARDQRGPAALPLAERHPLDRPGFLSLESLSACARLIGFERREILRLGGPRTPSFGLPGDLTCWEWAEAAPSLPFEAARFDLVFACGVIEHLGDVARWLEDVARVLRPGGALFAEVRPLWSSAGGHHLCVQRPAGTVLGGTLEAVLPRWCHLFWKEQEMAVYLAPIVGEVAAQHTARTVFRSPCLNRLLEDDLIGLLNRSPLNVERLEGLQIDPMTARLAERLQAAYPGHRQFAARGLRAVLRKPD